MQAVQNLPKIVPATEGHTTIAGPETFTVKLSSRETNGAFMLAEVNVDAPSYGPPYHVHEHEDETFMVLEGELHLIVDGTRHVVGPGGVAYGPRNVPHRYESGPNGARFTVMVTGDNFERFIPRFQAALNAGEFDRLPTIAGEHGITLLG